MPKLSLLLRSSHKSKRLIRHALSAGLIGVVLALTLSVPGGVSQATGLAAPALSDPNPNPPPQPVKLIFIHHSTGGYWLADAHGQLGLELRDNNYFVSATNYGWGPNGVGDYTDIGNWYTWFGSGRDSAVSAAVYTEAGKNTGSFGDYSRLATDPGGENEIIIFKSCFPNSALRGNLADPIPAIANNPLRGQEAGSSAHTVANAKGIYLDLLSYFQSRPDKLFVVITAPPLSDGTYAANARAFNNWLMDKSAGWLKDYPLENVAVFDFFNVLTTNGGDANTNDLGLAGGNHHRWWAGAIQHQVAVGSNVLAYPTSDDHPSAAGDQKASKEFVTLLNVFYHRWKDAGTATATPTWTPSATVVLPTATPTWTPSATAVLPTATPTWTPSATAVLPTATPTWTPSATVVLPTATPTWTPSATAVLPTATPTWTPSATAVLPTATPTATSSGGALPSPWQHQDIGAVGVAGQAGYAAGVFQVQGSGFDIWYAADGFHFVYQPLTGNGEIVARVISVEATHPWAKAGVMIRASLAANAPFAMVIQQPDRQVDYEWRLTPGGSAAWNGAEVGGTTAVKYVRVVRSGNTFTGYYSMTGAAGPWTAIGSPQTIAMGSEVYVGLVVTALDNTRLCAAQFDNVGVTVEGSPTNTPTRTSSWTPSATPVIPTATSTAMRTMTPTQTAVLPTATSTRTPSATAVLPTATSTATRTMTPTQTAVIPTATSTRTPSATPVLPTATSTATRTMTPTQTAVLPTATSTATRTMAPTQTPMLPTATRTMTPTQTPVLPTATPTATSSGGALPSPWQHQDIGAVGVAGQAGYAAGVFQVQGSGFDIWYAADGFHFVYQPLTGNGEIVARVISVEATHPWAKAGVMIRASLAANAPFAMVIQQPDRQVDYEWRLTPGGSAAWNGAEVGGTTAVKYVRVVRSGNTFTGYYSMTGAAGPWTAIGSPQTIAMGSEVYVGLVVTALDNTRLCAAQFDNVGVR